jgi:hypothetical protein
MIADHPLDPRVSVMCTAYKLEKSIQGALRMLLIKIIRPHFMRVTHLGQKFESETFVARIGTIHQILDSNFRSGG